MGYVATVSGWQLAGTWVVAVGTLVTAGVLAATLSVVIRQVREAASLRLAQVRPYVVPAIDVEQRELAMLTLENTGATAAINVRLDIDPPPQLTRKDVADVQFINGVTPTLPPGRKFRVSWDNMGTIVAKDSPHPWRYTATVTYTDQAGRDYGPEPYVLDFNAFRYQALAPPELAWEVKKLREQQERWGAQGGRGLLTYTVDRDRQTYVRERELLIRGFSKLRQQHGWRAAGKEVVQFYLTQRRLPVPRWLR